MLLIVTKTQAKAIRVDVNTRGQKFVCLGLYLSALKKGERERGEEKDVNIFDIVF